MQSQETFNIESCEDTAELETLMKSEAIGDTMYDKRWALSLVLELSQRDDFDLDDLESKLCPLVDMSIEKDVCVFLFESGCYNVIWNQFLASEQERRVELTLCLIANIWSHKNLLDRILVEYKYNIWRAPMQILFKSQNGSLLTALFTALKVLSKHFTDEEIEPSNVSLLIDPFQDESVIERISSILSASCNQKLLGEMAKFIFNYFEVSLQHELSLDRMTCPPFSDSIIDAWNQCLELSRIKFTFLQIVYFICRLNSDSAFSNEQNVLDTVVKYIDGESNVIEIDVLMTLTRICSCIWNQNNNNEDTYNAIVNCLSKMDTESFSDVSEEAARLNIIQCVEEYQQKFGKKSS